MTRTAAVLATVALFVAVPAQAASPTTIAKRAAIAKAKALTGATSARIKGITLIGPGKRYEIGASATGGDVAAHCDVFMRVTVVRQRATKIQVTGKHCFPAPAESA